MIYVSNVRFVSARQLFLHSFLGLTAGMAHWFPDMTTMVNALRLMTHKNQVFDWKEVHEEEFVRAKKIMCDPVYVHPFDMELDAHLFVDTSKLYGVGFIFLQREKGEKGAWRLIRCGSSCAKKYWSSKSPILLEFIGILFAVKKLDFYISRV